MTPESRDSFAEIVPVAPSGHAVLQPAVRTRPRPEAAVQEQHERAGPQAHGDARHRSVANLDKLETSVPAVQDLGRRHETCGVPPEKYDTVATALLWILGLGLSEAFAPPVESAWTEAYTILATVMKDAVAP
jgi:hemoglobin-like flavoprotein